MRLNQRSNFSVQLESTDVLLCRERALVLAFSRAMILGLANVA